MTNMEKAKEKLFGEGGLNASDIKVSVGEGATPDGVAEEILKVLGRLERGEFTVLSE